MVRLRPSQLRAFREDGFVVIPGLFDPTRIRAASAAFDRLAARAAALGTSALKRVHRGSEFVVEGDPVRIHRVVWCGGAEDDLSRLGMCQRVVGVAAQLLGSPQLVQLINQAHFKHPGDGVAFPWHQDSRHRRYGTPAWTDVDGRGSFVEIAAAIDPVGPDNGPLRFVPGSHRLGHLGLAEDGSLPVEVDPRGVVAPRLQPGDAVAFGPFMIHGSEPNRGRRSRRMFLNGFALPGANRRIYPGCGTGRPVEWRGLARAFTRAAG